MPNASPLLHLPSTGVSILTTEAGNTYQVDPGVGTVTVTNPGEQPESFELIVLFDGSVGARMYLRWRTDRGATWCLTGPVVSIEAVRA